jgi:hypothetical protein
VGFQAPQAPLELNHSKWVLPRTQEFNNLMVISLERPENSWVDRQLTSVSHQVTDHLRVLGHAPAVSGNCGAMELDS